MENTNTLEMLRNQIDNIDNEILILLKRRLQLAKKIADFKIQNNLEVFQKDREDMKIFQLSKKSIEMNLNENFIRNLFENIITESRNFQNEYIEKKYKK